MRMTRTGFIARYGGVYEHSPWIAEALWDKTGGKIPQETSALADAMASIVADADEAAKLALLRAHPDLAGKAAIAGRLTRASSEEQAGAGLDQCTQKEFARFTALNTAYREKFGFPFIIAVRGLDRQAILEAFEQRLTNSRAAELQSALAQVNTIARLRLAALEAGS